MKCDYNMICCPTCLGKGMIERKRYVSNCLKARRHLYTNKKGERVNHCVHCGKVRLSLIMRKI